MSEFAGCPFCRREPRYTVRAATESERSTTGEMHFAACMCGGYSARAHQFAYSKAELLEKWNRREPPPATAAVLREFRRLVDRIDDMSAVAAIGVRPEYVLPCLDEWPKPEDRDAQEDDA